MVEIRQILGGAALLGGVTAAHAASRNIGALQTQEVGISDIRDGQVSTQAGCMNQDKAVGADSTVQIAPNGSVNVSFTGENTGNAPNELYVGISFRDPDGNLHDLALESAGTVNDGDQFTIDLSNVGTDKDGQTIFDQEGLYSVMVTVFDNSDGTCPLTPFLEVTGAIEVAQVNDAQVARVEIDGTQVF